MAQSTGLCFTSKDFLFILPTECVILTSYRCGFIFCTTMRVALPEKRCIKFVRLLQKEITFAKLDYKWFWNYKQKLDFFPFCSLFSLPSPSLPLVRNEQQVGQFAVISAALFTLKYFCVCVFFFFPVHQYCLLLKIVSRAP